MRGRGARSAFPARHGPGTSCPTHRFDFLLLVRSGPTGDDRRPKEFPFMPLLLHCGSLATSRPGWIVALWVAAAVAVGLCAPDLTRLAAEGQGNLLGRDAESLRAGEALRLAWPDQAYESLAVAALHRPGGLSATDIGYAKRLVAADRGARSSEGGATRARAGLATGGRRSAAQQGRDGRARSRASVDLVRRPGDPRSGRLARVADAGGSARPSGRAGSALGGRRHDRARLHGRRQGLARPRRGRHRRSARSASCSPSTAPPGWLSSRWRRSGSAW